MTSVVRGSSPFVDVNCSMFTWSIQAWTVHWHFNVPSTCTSRAVFCSIGFFTSLSCISLSASSGSASLELRIEDVRCINGCYRPISVAEMQRSQSMIFRQNLLNSFHSPMEGQMFFTLFTGNATPVLLFPSTPSLNVFTIFKPSPWPNFLKCLKIATRMKMFEAAASQCGCTQ